MEVTGRVQAEAMTDEQRIPGTGLEDAGVPEGPAVYCWWDEGTPLCVGAADNLRHQVLERDLRGGRRLVPQFRKAARARLQLLGRWPLRPRSLLSRLWTGTARTPIPEMKPRGNDPPPAPRPGGSVTARDRRG